MVSVTDRSSPRGFIVRWVELTCGEVNDAQVDGYIVRYGLLSEIERRDHVRDHRLHPHH